MLVMELPVCQRCKLPYVWKKSNSSLKMTYCSFSCEVSPQGLGFSLEALEKGQFTRGGMIVIDEMHVMTDEDMVMLVESAGPSVKRDDGDDRDLVPV